MPNNHYVDNKQMFECIVEYKAQCIVAKRKKVDKPPIPEYIGKCIIMISQRLSLKPNFINYSFRDEMISDGIENCISYFDNFDPARSTNPFAYFTQIIYYAFLRRILKERKQQYIKHKSFENQFDGSFDEPFGHGEGDDHKVQQTYDIDNQKSVDFIKAFEDTLKDKKARMKRKKKIKGIEVFLEEQ